MATVLTIAALAVGLTSKAALVILGALATAFGFRHVSCCWPASSGDSASPPSAPWSVSFSGMIAVALTYNIWPNPLSMHCAFWGTCLRSVVAYLCRGVGIKDDEETIERQKEVRTFLDSIDEPSESGKAWRKVMKSCRAGMVFLRHRAGLYPGATRPSPSPASRPVVLADRLVDPRYRHDVGAVLQG
jgi:SSS family solute:Na+ symporter